jgi:intracellular sulfur oxidation DsrE/DsrF family protein
VAFAAVIKGYNMTNNPLFPAIEGLGGIYPFAGAGEQPEKGRPYQVLFSISKPAPAPGQLNPGLERVARLVNLLAQGGVTVSPGEIVAIVHDKATPIVLNDAAYRAMNGIGNPNLALIKALLDAGLQVHVCSQALAAHSLAPEKVERGVQIDVAAILTIPNFARRGFALIPL